MTFFERIFRSNFFIKLRSWEYWPFGVVQAPFFFYWLWCSLKARSLFYFSASNPGIFSGGMLGELKSDVLKLVPEEYKAKTILVKLPSTAQDILQSMALAGISFPVICKPDLGERGWMVRKINNVMDVEKYVNEIKIDFLVQEFLDLPLEFGVYYARRPSEKSGRVVSITSKEMLTVVGDGVSTIENLVEKNNRAKLQAGRLKMIFNSKWNEVIEDGQAVVLNSIGNHCLGTTFLNGNNLITPQLNESFDSISKKIEGFNFGRYDLRCASLDDLQIGKVKIMELNGCGAEPSHIYQPGYSFWMALGELYKHFRLMYVISKENHQRGVPYLSFAEGKRTYFKVRNILGKS